MDPNATLRELRDLVKVMLSDRTVELKDLPTYLDQHLHVAELFESLDNWLSKGGFPPKAWQPPPVPEVTSNPDALRQRNQEFSAWRERVNDELPNLARRVFALRGKMYMGCGYHRGLEKSLGGVLQGVNDYDDERYYYSADSALRQATLQVCFESLCRNIQRAEESIKRLATQRQGIRVQPTPASAAEVSSPEPSVPRFNLDEVAKALTTAHVPPTSYGAVWPRCPHCGAADRVSLSNEWEARSTEPQDAANHGLLQEYQCGHCARSFWIDPPAKEQPA